MTTSRTLARLDALIWTLIFGGLLTLVLGIATHGQAEIAGWSLSVIGGVAAAAGVVLIVVRSRLREEAPAGTARNDKDKETPA